MMMEKEGNDGEKNAMLEKALGCGIWQRSSVVHPMIMYRPVGENLRFTVHHPVMIKLEEGDEIRISIYFS